MKSESGPRSPAVSIVVPTLNEERYIGRCLRSIKGQRFGSRYELIIADGASEDSTRKIAKRYADRIVIEPIRTIAAGRQAGAKAARGELIVYAGADVTQPEDWLEEITKPFSDEHVVAVTGKPMPQDGTLLENLFCDFVLHPLALVLNRLSLFYVYGDNFAIRKSVFEQTGGFNRKLVTGEDTDIVKRASAFGKVVYNPRAVAFSSRRRWQKWGAPRYLIFHTANFISTYLFNKPSGEYERVR